MHARHIATLSVFSATLSVIAAATSGLALYYSMSRSMGGFGGNSGPELAKSPGGAYAQFSSEGFDSPCLTFFDDRGRVRMEIGLTKIGSPFIFMSDPDAGQHVFSVIGSMINEAPVIFIRSPKHPSRSWQISVDDSGNAVVVERGAAKTEP